MGGRIALHVALAAPERIERLILMSTTAGIEDEQARARRQAADEALAARTESGSIEGFADAWSSQPLFAGTAPAAAAEWRKDLLRNDPKQLAVALRGLGTGAMRPLWAELTALRMPAEVVVGERDEKYRALGEELVAGLPDARLHVVPGAGHGLPREAPAALAAIIATA